MIKKLLHKLRIWLIKMLNAVPAEDFMRNDCKGGKDVYN